MQCYIHSAQGLPTSSCTCLKLRRPPRHTRQNVRLQCPPGGPTQVSRQGVPMRQAGAVIGGLRHGAVVAGGPWVVLLRLLGLGAALGVGALGHVPRRCPGGRPGWRLRRGVGHSQPACEYRLVRPGWSTWGFCPGMNEHTHCFPSGCPAIRMQGQHLSCMRSCCNCMRGCTVP